MYLLGVILLLGITLVIVLLAGEIRQRRAGASLLRSAAIAFACSPGAPLVCCLLAIGVGAFGAETTTTDNRPLLFFAYWLICLLLACALVFLALFDLGKFEKCSIGDINDLWRIFRKILSQEKQERLSSMTDSPFSASDIRFMKIALSLASEVLVAPAQIPASERWWLRGERLSGRGYHHRAGGPHAEIFALEGAGKAARGADLYVTLEPCCHFGRTPPCVAAILRARYQTSFHRRTSDPQSKSLRQRSRKVEWGRSGSARAGLLEADCRRS